MKLIRYMLIPLFSAVSGVPSCAPMTAAERNEADRASLSKEVADEILIGRTMAAKLLGHFGSYSNEAAVRYVELVGRLIAARVGRPELTYRFAVLDCPQVNAYATPGGYVFVTRGLLKALRGEAELAGILSHEVAHINERHMYRELRPQKEVSAGESIVRMLSRGGSTLGGSISKLVEAGMKTLLEKGLSAEKEKEADEIGLMYAAHAGYSPAGLVDFLKRQKPTPKDRPGRVAGLLTHLKAQGLREPAGVSKTILSERFQRSLATVK